MRLARDVLRDDPAPAAQSSIASGTITTVVERAPMRLYLLLPLFAALTGCVNSNESPRDDRPRGKSDVDIRVDEDGADVDVERRPRRDRDVDVDINRNGIDVDVDRDRGRDRGVDVDINRDGKGIDIDVDRK